MVDQSLLEYVKKSLSAGLSNEVISQNLAANGWSELVIKEALSTALIPPAPLAPGHVAPQQPQTAISNPRKIRNYSIYSPFSVLLAFVLFFGLLILANKAVSDFGLHFGRDITARLIAQTLLILPFLVAAIALHFGLTEKGEKYRIISHPFYLVAGWLLVRILFNVSAYILSSQVVYGVYIVLLLVVVVLTGGIFFIQKFIRHKDQI
ncbi:MAG: hypothetical protein KW802_00035 [Candidatus Doudnabacteria bacterium]|nr:hypothetical protein [Candidatus Doudnabacteria bacterium]